VADIFQEIDEDIRREKLQKLWQQHGPKIVILAVLIVAAVGAWRGYAWWEAKQAAEAGARFEQAVALAEQGKHAEAEEAFAKVAADSPKGYRVLARFRAAEELGRRDAQAAVAAYDAIVADSGVSQVMHDLAVVRAGLLLVDTAPHAQLRERLEPVTGSGRTFRHTARELLALSAWRNGDGADARHWIDIIMTDSDTPATARSRAEVLMALTANAGKG
jgi:hypothetical protein